MNKNDLVSGDDCLSGRRNCQILTGDIGPILNVENEPRILQIATPKSEKPIVVANTHLAATADWSMQVVDIANILRPCAKSEIVILCGDFNAAPASSDLPELREVLPYIHSSEVAAYVKEPSSPPVDFFLCSAPLEVDISIILRTACRITTSSLRRLTGTLIKSCIELRFELPRSPVHR